MPLRVIAGRRGGRRLVAPKGGTRPTTDRLKEALFASLGHRIDDAAVLDLYAGSGALGDRGARRGARRARCWSTATAAAEVAVPRQPRDHRLRRPSPRSQRSPVARFLRAGASRTRPFDLVFLDPPYDVAVDRGRGRAGAAWPRGAVARARARPSSSSGPSRATPIALPDGWGTEKERAYGDTLLVVAIA